MHAITAMVYLLFLASRIASKPNVVYQTYLSIEFRISYCGRFIVYNTFCNLKTWMQIMSCQTRLEPFWFSHTRGIKMFVDS